MTTLVALSIPHFPEPRIEVDDTTDPDRSSLNSTRVHYLVDGVERSRNVYLAILETIRLAVADRASAVVGQPPGWST